MEHSDATLAQAHRQLVEEQLLAPVVGDQDERLWVDCELASLAENRLGDLADPRTLTEAQRATWRSRATREHLAPPSKRTWDACYWILDGARRIGTVSLSRGTLGTRRARLGSLYIFTEHRGRGAGIGALRRVCDTFGQHGTGVGLETAWTWQRAVRSYLRSGLWVRMWKRDLDFVWDPDVPAPAITVADDTAALEVEQQGRTVVLIRASRTADRLVVDMGAPPDAEGLSHLPWDALSTLSVALACRGWPLLRSPEHWEESRFSDGGPPEALAYRITMWEAWCRHQGWNVDTPRIPGLDYPTWEQLEEGWERERLDLDLAPA